MKMVTRAHTDKIDDRHNKRYGRKITAAVDFEADPRILAHGHLARRLRDHHLDIEGARTSLDTYTTRTTASATVRRDAAKPSQIMSEEEALAFSRDVLLPALQKTVALAIEDATEDAQRCDVVRQTNAILHNLLSRVWTQTEEEHEYERQLRALRDKLCTHAKNLAADLCATEASLVSSSPGREEAVRLALHALPGCITEDHFTEFHTPLELSEDDLWPQEDEEDINELRLADVVDCALSGGSNYWIKSVQRTNGTGPLSEVVTSGGSLEIACIGEYAGRTRTLDRKAVLAGQNAMQKHYARLWSEIITNSYDANAADVFLQCCMFGKTIYG